MRAYARDIVALADERDHWKKVASEPVECHLPNIAGKRWPDLTQTEQRAFLDWIVTTCLLFGTELKTALRVAAEFCEGIEFEYRVEDTKSL